MSYAIEVLAFLVSVCMALALFIYPAAGEESTVDYSAEYKITFEGEWTRKNNHPSVRLPGNAHFSPIIGAVHNKKTILWRVGDKATPGFTDVAEIGVNGRFEKEIKARRGNGIFQVISGSGNIDNSGRDVIRRVRVDDEHSYLTIATMIAPSHDWFVGVSGLSLRDGDGNWKDEVKLDLYAYDAGTEIGDDFALSPNTRENGTIRKLDGVSTLTDRPFATVRIERVK